MKTAGVDPSLLAMADAFDKIHECVDRRPDLVGFADATRQLRELAKRVRAGEVISSSIRATAVESRIVSEEVARDILAILEETSDREFGENPADEWSWLGISLTKAIMHAIMRDYPHLTRDSEA